MYVCNLPKASNFERATIFDVPSCQNNPLRNPKQYTPTNRQPPIITFITRLKTPRRDRTCPASAAKRVSSGSHRVLTACQACRLFKYHPPYGHYSFVLAVHTLYTIVYIPKLVTSRRAHTRDGITRKMPTLSAVVSRFRRRGRLVALGVGHPNRPSLTSPIGWLDASLCIEPYRFLLLFYIQTRARVCTFKQKHTQKTHTKHGAHHNR